MNSAKLGNFTVFFENGEEYHRIKREVWGSNTYYVELDKEDPIILDIGAHIGLTTLYFKRLFPSSRIIAYEPFPRNAELFRKNMFENQIENVELYEEAIAEYDGNKAFYYDQTGTEWYSTAGFIPGAWNNEQESAEITVTTTGLGTVLETYKPDLVKMDIEGAEEHIIISARDSLTLCPHYLIEFHPVNGVGMDKIVRLFDERGYRITVTKDGRVVPWNKAIGLSLIEVQK